MSHPREPSRRSPGALALAGALLAASASLSLSLSLVPTPARAARDPALDGADGPLAAASRQALNDYAYTLAVQDPRPRTDQGTRVKAWEGAEHGDVARLAVAQYDRGLSSQSPHPPASLAAADTNLPPPGFRVRTTPAPVRTASTTTIAARDSVPPRGLFAMPMPPPAGGGDTVAPGPRAMTGGGPRSIAARKGPQPTVADENASGPGVRSAQRVPLQLGYGCSTITAVGSPSVREVALRVIDPSGGRTVHDAREGRTESLSFCPARPGAYALDVQLSGGGTGPLAAQVFVGR